MPNPIQKSMIELTAQVEKFNRRFQKGSKVLIKLDGGATKQVTVKAEAQVLGGHSAVGWFEELSGCYSLDRVI